MLLPASVASSDGMSVHTPVSATNNPGSHIIVLAGLPAWPVSSTSTLDPMLDVVSAPGGIELLAANVLLHAHAHTQHTHAHQVMSVSVHVGSHLSGGGESSSSGLESATSVGMVAWRTAPQMLSSSPSPYLSFSLSMGGMHDQINYDYELVSL